MSATSKHTIRRHRAEKNRNIVLDRAYHRTAKALRLAPWWRRRLERLNAVDRHVALTLLLEEALQDDRYPQG